MAKVAKVHDPLIQERDVWKAIIRYANTSPSDSAPSQEEDFMALINAGFDWLGGDGRDSGDDMGIFRDLRDGTSLKVLADRYRSDLRNMLAWLVSPDMWLSASDDDEAAYQDFAWNAGEFLNLHATDIRMSVLANTEFDPLALDPDGRALVAIWPEECGSVIAPICKFVLDQIVRHDKCGEELRKAIPIGHCDRLDCGRFFIVERVGRGRFCSASCRAKAYQSGMTRGEKATRMAEYRAKMKEMASSS
jgi:hypothetical protein